MQRNKNCLRRLGNVLYSGYSYFFSHPKKIPITVKHFEQKPIHPVKPKIQGYDQAELLPKINKYLELMKRPLMSTKGYCHGLTLLWLYKMSEKEEDWFYRIIKQIIDYPLNKFREIEDIDKFLIFIEWAQNTSRYAVKEANCIWYREVDKVLQIEKIYPRRKLTNRVRNYTPTQLSQFFRKNLADDVMITLVSKESPDMHTVGIFIRDFQYYFYDANDCSGRAERISLENFDELFALIRNSLYTTFNIEVSEHEIPLELIVTRVIRKQSARLTRTPEEDRISLHKDALFSYMAQKIPQPGTPRVTFPR